ncbi:hypothetical protein D3C73_216130 [compost metagenome]
MKGSDRKILKTLIDGKPDNCVWVTCTVCGCVGFQHYDYLGYHCNEKLINFDPTGFITSISVDQPISCLSVEPTDNNDSYCYSHSSPIWRKRNNYPHDWHNYVSEDVRAMWQTFTEDQKLKLFECFDEIAGREEWD